MAAKEHQGLQAAVIAFFILTVILAVTTYLGFSGKQEETARANKNQEDMNTARTALTKTQGEYNDLKRFTGYPPEEVPGTIAANYEKDMQEHAVLNLPEAEKAYRPLIAALDTANKNKEMQLAQAKRDMDAYTASTNQTIDGLRKSLAAAEAAVKTATEDLQGEITKFNKDREELQARLVKAEQERDAKDKELTTALAAAEKTTKDLTERNNILNLQNQGYKRNETRLTGTSFEVPDGKVTHVVQRGNMVYLNIGHRHGLKNKVTFSVYDPEQVNVKNAKPKGKIEVIGNPNATSSEARIIDQDFSNPILPNDVIYSPVWHHGQPQHFALAGVIDLDNDGVSDRSRILDLIRINGGVVDAYVGQDGKIQGAITPQTKYLIVGGSPEVKASGTIDPSIEADATNYATLVGQADDYSVDTITLQQFLDSIGYTPTLHPRGRSMERQRTPGGAQPGAASDTDSAFRVRQPPARGAGGGAF